MAAFTVTTLNDMVNAGDGRLSLREAIGQANATTAADTIGFAAALDGGTVVLRGGQLTVTRDLTIDGDPNDDGNRVTIDADEKTRVMEVSGSGSDMTLDGIVLERGKAAELYDGAPGAGVLFGGGRLRVQSSDIVDNFGGFYGMGGGICMAAGSNLTLQDANISRNLSGDGGGIYASEGCSLLINDSSISQNGGSDFYFGRGGGIFGNASSLVTKGTSIYGNSAYEGGGIYVNDSILTLMNTTISDNTALNARIDSGDAGAIKAYGQSVLTISSSTITGNSAQAASYDGGVGGISASRLSMSNSIVAGNSSQLAQYRDQSISSDIQGSVNLSNGHNIFGSSVSGAVAGDCENVDPSLIFATIDSNAGGGRLALNGGPTPTVALRDNVTNPALSGADPFDAEATDQRGFARPQPGTSNPDIGAFELNQRSLSNSPSVNNDVLSGSGAANILAAREGNDLVQGNGGNDSLDGGSGGDTLRGGDGNDGLTGGFGNDGLDGGAGQDRALYRLDTDRGFGLTIDLTAGTAVSGSERDRLVSVEEVGGSIRDDTVIGSAGANAFLNGAEGQDLVFGRGGNDTVYGGPDDDQVLGEAGNDVLLGNAGADRLTGGAGRDRFDFDAGDTGAGVGQRDLVLDFARGSDRLDLARIDADDDRAGNQAFAFTGTRAFTGVDGQLRYVSTSGQTLVQGDLDGDRAADVEIELAGRLSLAASDFVL